MYRVNYRVLLGVLAATCLVVIGTRLLYKRQAGKQTVVLLEQANAAETEGEYAKAVGYLRRYLALAPDDPDARARLGLLMTRTAQSPTDLAKSYLVLDEVLRTSPDRHDVRRRAVEIGLALGTDLLPDVKRHLDALIRSHPADGQLEEQYATAHLLEARFEEARVRFETAVRKQPSLYSAHVQLALVLRRRLNRAEDADRVVADMLAANGGSFRAHLAAASYWEATGDLDRRAGAVARAKQLAPDDLEVLLAVGELSQVQARLATGRGDKAGATATLSEARGVLREGIERYAADVADDGPPTPPARDAGTGLRRRLVADLFRQLVALEVLAAQPAEAVKVAERGVQLFPEAVGLHIAQIDAYIRQKRFDDADRVLDRIEQGGYVAHAIPYHRGRILAGRGDWLGAIKTLEALTRDAQLPGDLFASAALVLGGCYEQIGEVDRRYAIYRKATAIDRLNPHWVEVHNRLAVTLVEMRRHADAVGVYETMTASGVSGANVPLARLLLAEMLRRPEGQRNWDRVEKTLRAAPDGVEATVLRAELAVVRNDGEGARELLSEAIKKYPDAIRPRLALATLEHKAGRAARATEVLGEARSTFGATADLRLAEARMLTGPDAPAGLERLADGADRLPAQDAKRLLAGLAELAEQAGSPGLATRLRERISAHAPSDLGVYLARLDDAIQRKDGAAARAMLDRVRDIDGEAGTSFKAARAIFLIWRAQAGEGEGLAEAEELLDAVERQRPWWSRVAFAKALVADLRGNQAAAVSRYREAVDAGDRRPEVLKRLLELYFARQQYREAEELIRQLPEAAGAPGTELLVAELSARSGNLTRAAEFAARGVPPDSTDPKRLLWLAQVRRLAGAPPAEVERPIRRAVEVAGDQPDPWVALTQFLTAAGRRPEAEHAVSLAERAVRGPGRSLALAQCQELLGNTGRAREMFAAALTDRPTDVATARAGVNFYLRNDEPERAKELCQRILGLQKLEPEDRQFAVQMLAVIFSNRQDYQSSQRWLEEIGVLERGLPTRLTGSETVEQLHARAVALSLQPDVQLRRDAVAALEAIELRRPLSSDDQFFLARVCESVGEWPKARGRLAQLARSGSDNALHLAYYGYGLLRHDDDAREARRVLGLLEQVQPDSVRTVGLKARVLDSEGKLSEAADLLLSTAKRHPQRAEFAARLLEDLGQGPRAEPLYRQLAADPKSPTAVLRLAAYLGRQGQTREALSVAQSAAGKVPSAAMAAVAVEVVYNAARVEAADLREAESLVRAAAAGTKGFDPRPMIAAVRMIEGRNREAIALYREVLSRETTDPVSMNNLGYLLAVEAKQYDEALGWVRKAQKLAGPVPMLRDTEAVILTRMGKPEAAVELLVGLTRESTDPAPHFHLAQAYLACDNKPAAAAALKRARRWRIRPIDLPPPERRELEALLATPR